jgi:hypothetical protein
MKKVISFIFLVSIGCRQSPKIMSKNNLSSEMNHYQDSFLKKLDSMGYTNYQVESKWKIYLKYCDKQIVLNASGDKINYNKYFGESSVLLRYAQLKDSLLYLTFYSILDDSLNITCVCFNDHNYCYNFYLGHIYNVKTGRFYGYGLNNSEWLDSTTINDYCNKSPNCNKKEFVEKNRKRFDKWFIDEAVRRKFIEK